MIPAIDIDLAEVETITLPSLNYKMHLDSERVAGKCTDKDAMTQVIYKILMTERYQYVIYPWEYGIELHDLFGQPVTLVVPELQRRITEALLQDDRIESVDEFEFDTSQRHTVMCTFKVHTIFGDVEAEKEYKYV